VRGVAGSVISLGAAVSATGWNVQTAALAFASMGLTFAMWWTNVSIPFGEILHAHRERSFTFGYGHLPIYGAIAGLGAGLHVVAYYVEAGHDPEVAEWVHIGPVGAVLAVAIPVVIFIVSLFAMWSALFRSTDPGHLFAMLGATGAILGTVLLAKAGVSVAWCLIVLCLAPAIIVLAYEVRGHEHQAAALARQSDQHG